MKKYFYSIYYVWRGKPASQVNYVYAESPKEALDIIQSTNGDREGYHLNWVYAEGDRVQ